MDIRSTLFCSLLVVGTIAHAEGFYVLGSIGQSHSELKDLSKSDLDDAFGGPAVDAGLDYSSKLDHSDTGYKLQLGYQFNENFALEGGYVDLGKTEYKFTISDGVDSASGNLSYDTKGWDIDGVLTLPVNAGVSVFGKLGLIRAETKFKAGGVLDDQDLDESTTKTAPLFGVGVAWNFYRELSARVEWERFFGLGDKDQIGSKIDIDLFSLGLSYQF